LVSVEQVRQALARDELVFHYQPKVSFLTGRVQGAEALMRWRREDGELVPPGEFIPVAEAHGLMPAITQRMFPRLLADFRRIRAASEGDGEGGTVALNVTAYDLDAPRFLALVRHALGEGAIDNRHLELEITESALVSGSGGMSRTLAGLVAAGVDLLMDDYGTGFSSLDSLHRLPFSAIKLDHSFVLKMLHSPKSATLVKASIAMAQMLGIKTVVEGIETEGVYQALLHSGCDDGQGFWISHPLPLDEYLRFLRGEPRFPSSPIGMLRMAQLSHNWQHKLLVDVVYALLASREVPTAALQGLHVAHDECPLGRWHNGPGRIFAGDPDFDAMEQPHREMHDICAEILNELSGPLHEGEMERLLTRLSEDTCKVSDCLQRLETRLMLSALQHRAPAVGK
jgi:EAL domain-containing protein (putative c-di-GMP-specific phosphodiesterase class I)